MRFKVKQNTCPNVPRECKIRSTMCEKNEKKKNAFLGGAKALKVSVTLQPRSDTWPPLVARDTLFRARKYHFATFRVKMEKYSSTTGRGGWNEMAICSPPFVLRHSILRAGVKHLHNSFRRTNIPNFCSRAGQRDRKLFLRSCYSAFQLK